MALPSSGQLSIGDIRTELGSTSGSLRTLSAAAGKSTPDSISEFYGYSSFDPAWIDVHSIQPEGGSSFTGQGISSDPWVFNMNTYYAPPSAYGGDLFYGQIQVKLYNNLYQGAIKVYAKMTSHTPSISNGSEPGYFYYYLTTSTVRPSISLDLIPAVTTYNSSFPTPPINTVYVNHYGTTTNTSVQYFTLYYQEDWVGLASDISRYTWEIWFEPA